MCVRKGEQKPFPHLQSPQDCHHKLWLLDNLPGACRDTSSKANLLVPVSSRKRRLSIVIRAFSPLICSQRNGKHSKERHPRASPLLAPCWEERCSQGAQGQDPTPQPEQDIRTAIAASHRAAASSPPYSHGTSSSNTSAFPDS